MSCPLAVMSRDFHPQPQDLMWHARNSGGAVAAPWRQKKKKVTAKPKDLKTTITTEMISLCCMHLRQVCLSTHLPTCLSVKYRYYFLGSLAGWLSGCMPGSLCAFFFFGRSASLVCLTSGTSIDHETSCCAAVWLHHRHPSIHRLHKGASCRGSSVNVKRETLTNIISPPQCKSKNKRTSCRRLNKQNCHSPPLHILPTSPTHSPFFVRTAKSSKLGVGRG